MSAAKYVHWPVPKLPYPPRNSLNSQMKRQKKPKSILTWQNAISVASATSLAPMAQLKLPKTAPTTSQSSPKKAIHKSTETSQWTPANATKNVQNANRPVHSNSSHISKVGFDGKPVQDVSTLSPTGKKRVQVTVDIKKQYCPTCRACEYKCGSGAIVVKKAFEGKISINQQKCPEGCHDCVDVCPIAGTLSVGEDKKVHVNDLTCTYCGACKNVCPADDALSVNRSKVLHTSVHSGTWNKTLERITSPESATKEFTAQATDIRRHLVDKRFIVEEMKKK